MGEAGIPIRQYPEVIPQEEERQELTRGGRSLEQTPQCLAGKKWPYKTERKFGEAKKKHWLRHCRYMGSPRRATQAYLTAIAPSLKRVVKVLTGSGFEDGPDRCVRDHGARAASEGVGNSEQDSARTVSKAAGTLQSFSNPRRVHVWSRQHWTTSIFFTLNKEA